MKNMEKFLIILELGNAFFPPHHLLFLGTRAQLFSQTISFPGSAEALPAFGFDVELAV